MILMRSQALGGRLSRLEPAGGNKAGKTRKIASLPGGMVRPRLSLDAQVRVSAAGRTIKRKSPRGKSTHWRDQNTGSDSRGHGHARPCPARVIAVYQGNGESHGGAGIGSRRVRQCDHERAAIAHARRSTAFGWIGLVASKADSNHILPKSCCIAANCGSPPYREGNSRAAL
jgi:hypothetical protein